MVRQELKGNDVDNGLDELVSGRHFDQPHARALHCNVDVVFFGCENEQPALERCSGGRGRNK